MNFNLPIPLAPVATNILNFLLGTFRRVAGTSLRSRGWSTPSSRCSGRAARRDPLLDRAESQRILSAWRGPEEALKLHLVGSPVCLHVPNFGYPEPGEVTKVDKRVTPKVAFPRKWGVQKVTLLSPPSDFCSKGYPISKPHPAPNTSATPTAPRSTRSSSGSPKSQDTSRNTICIERSETQRC
jgi:hypothetical protein